MVIAKKSGTAGRNLSGNKEDEGRRELHYLPSGLLRAIEAQAQKQWWSIPEEWALFDLRFTSCTAVFFPHLLPELQHLGPIWPQIPRVNVDQL